VQADRRIDSGFRPDEKGVEMIVQPSSDKPGASAPK
jgi:hypothetical protein